LLEKAGFIDHQHRVLVRKMLGGIVAHQVAQRIGIPEAILILVVAWDIGPATPKGKTTDTAPVDAIDALGTVRL
jgi:hypothetical protein